MSDVYVICNVCHQHCHRDCTVPGETMRVCQRCMRDMELTRNYRMNLQLQESLDRQARGIGRGASVLGSSVGTGIGTAVTAVTGFGQGLIQSTVRSIGNGFQSSNRVLNDMSRTGMPTSVGVNMTHPQVSRPAILESSLRPENVAIPESDHLDGDSVRTADEAFIPNQRAPNGNPGSGDPNGGPGDGNGGNGNNGGDDRRPPDDGYNRNVPNRGNVSDDTSLERMFPSGVRVMSRLKSASESECVLLFKILGQLGDKDLPRLKYASNTRASDFEKWVMAVTRKLDSLHSKVADYWKVVVESAELFYENYLNLNQEEKIAFRVPVFIDLSEFYDQVEKKLRCVLVHAIPTTVMTTGRQWQEHECVRLLFNTLLEIGPGNLEDKNMVYAQVTSKRLVDPKQLSEVLSDWSFALDRLSKLGITQPDPAILIDVLLSFVQRHAERDKDFDHRLRNFIIQYNVKESRDIQVMSKLFSMILVEARSIQRVHSSSKFVVDSMEKPKLNSKGKSKGKKQLVANVSGKAKESGQDLLHSK